MPTGRTRRDEWHREVKDGGGTRHVTRFTDMEGSRQSSSEELKNEDRSYIRVGSTECWLQEVRWLRKNCYFCLFIIVQFGLVLLF